MSDLEKVVDKFSGFITREQAEYILKAEGVQLSSEYRKANMNVKELLDSIPARKPDERLQNSTADQSIVNVKDQIYRIFNPRGANVKGKDTVRRTVILGEEGSTIALNLRDKLSEFVDINLFERGDTMLVSNAIFDSQTGELRSSQNTVLNKISSSKRVPITDYSTIKEELRKADVIGRVLEISPIRQVTRLGNSGQMAVASCVITDSSNVIDASFWGTSALMTTSIKPNDFVKLEFCDVRVREGKLQIYANDDSRVVVHSTLGRKLSR